MDRSQRSCVAGIEGIEQRSRLDSADFAENDPVRTPSQSRLQKIVKRDLGLEGIGLAFDSENVRLLDAKLRRIFDDDNALIVGNCLGHDIEKCGLSTCSSAADEQCLTAANLFSKKVG